MCLRSFGGETVKVQMKNFIDNVCVSRKNKNLQENAIIMTWEICKICWNY